MDERLAQVARVRGGVFTTPMAAALDVDDTALTRWRRSGAVVRVRRNAYVLGEFWAAATPEQRLALRTHPRRIGLDSAVADGYRCVRIGQAVAQVLTRSGLVAAMVPLDAALHAGRCSLDEVSAALDGLCGSVRLGTLAERLLARADPACESVGETRTRLLLLDVGFDVRSQVEVRDGGFLVGRVDLLVGDRVVVEFDGALKYGGAEGRAALVAEKRREDALRSLGYTVVRVTWVDLADPAPLVARIRRALSGLSAPGADVPASGEPRHRGRRHPA